jgi:DEAD/DEAH box helicase domain-containing protein
VFGPGPADELLAFLGEDGHVHAGDDGRWYWASPDNFPASSISLRTAAEENVVIIDTTPDRPRVIGELDLFSAQTQVHEDAIYLHESAQFHVDRLDWDERKAYVRRVDVDHYTQAELAVTLKPLDVFARSAVAGGQRVHGEVMVASRATIYKKLKFVTNENLGWGRIHLPELELQTTAYWTTLGEAAAGWRRAELDVALAGMGRALQAVASVLLMTDPRDLGLVAQVRSPHAEAPTIYLYEAVPGGVGLAERLWERHAELVAGAMDLVAACGCQGGCPSCTGPRPPSGDGGLDAKALVLRLLTALGQAARPDARVEAEPGRAAPGGGPAPAGGATPTGLAVTR